MMLNRFGGLTAVEILIVLIILAILAAVVIPQFTNHPNEPVGDAVKNPNGASVVDWNGVTIECYGDNLLFVKARGATLGGVLKAYTEGNHLELVSVSALDDDSLHKDTNPRLGYWVVVKKKSPATQSAEKP